MIRATGQYLIELGYIGNWNADGETAEECWENLDLKNWTPEQIAGINRDTFITRVNALANEQSLTEIRTKRNTLLAESDWVMLSDVVIPNIEEWRAYRQALRGLPQTVTDYNNVTYPQKPS